MSRTGIESCSPEMLKNLAVICSFVCYCNEQASQKNFSPKMRGNVQAAPENEGDSHRACVDDLLSAYKKLNPNSPILPTYPYIVPKEGESVPLLPIKHNNPLEYAIGEIVNPQAYPNSGGAPELLEDYMANKAEYSRHANRGAIQETPHNSGALSIQDAVIVWDSQYSAHSGNIQGLVKVNFPPHEWTDEEYINAIIIAGAEYKVHTITPTVCRCSGEEQNIDKGVGQTAKEIIAKQRQEVTPGQIKEQGKSAWALGSFLQSFRKLSGATVTTIRMALKSTPVW